MAVQPLSFTRHQHLTWKRYTNYFHAANHNLASLAAAEISRAAVALPLTFVHQQGQWSLCALLGLAPGQNLYVNQDGQWLGAFVPATFRAHPFHLGWQNTEASLCVDEDSDLLVSDGSGEQLFAHHGSLARKVEEIWGFLAATADSLLALEDASSALASSNVLEPWPITIQDAAGSRVIEGLHRVSEVALLGLKDADFGQLGRSGVLGIAYAQMLSMTNLSQLGKLAQDRALATVQLPTEAERTPMISLPNDSTIDWDWSKIGR